MKCLKNLKTGTIIRLDEFKANNMVGKEWKFVSKTEWKSSSRKPEPVVEAKTEETTISEKQLKRKKK
jgi:hypothetical protein